MRLAAALAAAALLTATAGAARSEALEPATYVVTFAAPPTANDLAMLGGVADASYGFRHVPAAVVVATPDALPLLRSLPGVRGVYANEAYRPLLSGATTASRADRAWDLGWTGAGVSVAVIDAGVDGTHPDLCAAPEFCRGTPVKTVQNVKVLGRQDHLAAAGVVYLENQLNTDSTSGHGSHVAGIAAGNGVASDGRFRGVAPGASVVGYGTGEAVEAVNVLAAYDHAIASRDRYGIRVINNSWGPGAFTDYDPDHPVNRATDAAWAAGISVVFGAGNDGTRTDSLNMFSAHPRAISAAGGRKDGHQAFFSSRGIPGSPLWRPTVMAPGENVTSVRASTGFTVHAADAGAGYVNPDAPTTEQAPYYATSSGTSMAAPHVSGVIALMQQASRDSRGVWLTPAEVRDILQNTARPMPDYQHHETGAGYVDAYAAVRAAAAGTATHPWDDATAYDVRLFSGSVGPGGAGFTATYEVLPGATSLSVMADWGPEEVVPANQDVDIELVRPDGTTFAGTFLRCNPALQPNGYSSFCSSAANERLVVRDPAPGAWRVKVGGMFAVSETVRGTWSAAYPDGVASPAPAIPAAVTVAAPAVAVAGRPAELTATVYDASGSPLPNAAVTWSASSGAVTHAETYADALGRAGAGAESAAPGRQTVTVTAGGASATATIDWLGVELTAPPAESTPGSASGGGWWLEGGSKRHVTLGAEYRAGAAAPGGGFEYDDKAGVRISGTSVERLVVDGGRATFWGPATINGRTGYRYEVTVTDGGPADTVRIVVTRPLWRMETGGSLGGGNLKVRPG